MAVTEDETRKQLAAGGEDQGIPFRTSFDPFNMIMQQLGRMDTKIDDLPRETRQDVQALDTKMGDLHQELRSSTRWIIGTIVAVAGVAVALASWLFR